MVQNDGSQTGTDTPGLGHLGSRLVVGALGVIVVLLLLGRLGEGEREDRKAFALSEGTIRLTDVGGQVEILRDERGIPHISASQEPGGWYGLGFVHAQDRLAQMLWLRRQAYGRTAEIEGQNGLAADRLARLLEIGRASRSAVEALPPESHRVLERYSDGVNARLARIREGKVEEPKWLREPIQSVDDWQPENSLALVKLLSWCMGGTLETTLVLDELIQRLGSVPARPFFPSGSSVDFGIAPSVPIAKDEGPSGGVLEAISAGQPTRTLCRGIGIPSGGAWVIGSRATDSGAPIVVANWHLAPSVPALFYESQIVAGGIDVAGATIPGSPIFWTGRNRSVAWAGVPASAPVADLFIETLREDQGLYQNGSKWAPLEERTEIVTVRDARGATRESELTIRRTRHGPLIAPLIETESATAEIQPVTYESGRAARALAWTGALAGDGLTSMLALIRSVNAASALEALESHHEPVLAMAYADQNGEGGVQVVGWLPKRPLPTGLVPVQGRLRSFDWRSKVPLAELPGSSLSDEGAEAWVIASDQPWPSRGGLDQMEWLWRPDERGKRLRSALGEQRREGKIDLRGASELLQDNRSVRAPRVVKALLSLARRGAPLSQDAEEIAQLLERWDGKMDAESSGAAAYHVVIEHLFDDLLEAPFGSSLLERYLASPHVRSQRAIESLLIRSATLRRAGGWTDEERVSSAARDSLREAWVSLNHRLGPTRARWSWGQLHRLRFHAVGPNITLSGRLAGALPFAGDRRTVNLAQHRPGLSFDVEGAATYRVAMDLASNDRVLSALIPGQSEHPGHPHFADGLGRFGQTRMPLFATSRLVIEEENPERLVLEPAP